MINFGQQRIAAYYDQLVKQYGHDPRACDASSRLSLELRYRALAEVEDLAGKSVLEVGCGFGDLGIYLLKHYQGINYTGIDLSAAMIQMGRQVNPGLKLSQVDLLAVDPCQQYDVVLAQGIFYLLGNDAVPKMQALIQKMFSLAREAVAFSAISTWSPQQNEMEFHVDPPKLLDWCRQLTPYLILRHDYHPGDLSLYLYRQPRKMPGLTAAAPLTIND